MAITISRFYISIFNTVLFYYEYYDDILNLNFVIEMIKIYTSIE